MSAADDFKAWRAQPEILAATWTSNAANLQLAYEAGRAAAYSLEQIADACVAAAVPDSVFESLMLELRTATE